MKKKVTLRILLSPLDWGLGHTTRCIPLIGYFLSQGHTVIVACHREGEELLRKEFPQLHYLPLRGYNISYSHSKRWFAFKILQQIPKIWLAVQQEHRWLNKAIVAHNIDIVISDNRYGFWHKKVPSVFITHQLSIATPFKALSGFVQKINYSFIARFSQCWVPDYQQQPSLAGLLSHPHKLPPIPVCYVGPLARLKRQPAPLGYKYKWLVLLSGPEPQRSVLEKLLVTVLTHITGPVLFVRGLPASSHILTLPAHCRVLNHLRGDELQAAMADSEYVIARSGYTTVMELLALQKKAMLIPTPGQTEQEYLAHYLMQNGWCYSLHQSDDISRHLAKAQQFEFVFPNFPHITLARVLTDALQALPNVSH